MGGAAALRFLTASHWSAEPSRAAARSGTDSAITPAGRKVQPGLSGPPEREPSRPVTEEEEYEEEEKGGGSGVPMRGRSAEMLSRSPERLRRLQPTDKPQR